MKRYNFLPDAILQQRHTKQIKRHFFFCATLLTTIIALGVLVIVFRSISIESQIKVQRDALKNAQHATAELNSIQSQIAQLDLEHLKFSALSNQIPTEAVISLIISKMPEKIAIGSLGWRIPDLVEIKTTKPDDKKKTGKYNRTKAPKPQFAELMIAGLAVSDGDVANFITHLSSHELFGQVNLIQSKEVTVNEQTLYEFYISARVPTNREFVITSAAE